MFESKYLYFKNEARYQKAVTGFASYFKSSFMFFVAITFKKHMKTNRLFWKCKVFIPFESVILMQLSHKSNSHMLQ